MLMNICIILVSIILAIVIFRHSSTRHKTGYILFLIWMIPSVFMDRDNAFMSYLEGHTVLNILYDPILPILLMAYGAIGIIEGIIRCFIPYFTFGNCIVKIKRKRNQKKVNTYINEITSEPVSDNMEEEDDDDTKINIVPVMPEKGKLLYDLLTDLNNMIGLSNVKKEINELIDVERYQQQREKQGLKRNDGDGAFHLIFSGNPGTGKTTVARMVAGIYKELGIISKGQLVEVDRSKLVGQYLGETARIVHKVVKASIGGVLFIDEAYALIQGGYKGDSYGQEALNTLLKEMEDHRNDLIVIVAGYTDKMEEFLGLNPGLKSRFKKTIIFEDYLPDEMLQIFKSYCNKDQNIISHEAEKILLEKLTILYNHRDKNFGNGRTVRNIYNEIIQRLSVRVSKIQKPSRQDLQTILPEDVEIITN